jgi:hypothetical protein
MRASLVDETAHKMRDMRGQRRIWGWLTLAAIGLFGGLFGYLRFFSGRMTQYLPSTGVSSVGTM